MSHKLETPHEHQKPFFQQYNERWMKNGKSGGEKRIVISRSLANGTPVIINYANSNTILQAFLPLFPLFFTFFRTTRKPCMYTCVKNLEELFANLEAFWRTKKKVFQTARARYRETEYRSRKFLIITLLNCICEMILPTNYNCTRA